MILPFGLIEQVLRLVNNLLESRPAGQREADARIWFAVWWPILKPLVPPDVAAKVEELTKQ